MSHEHRRADDSEPMTKAELVDGAYKVGKILAMVLVAFAGLMTVRDRLEAVPVLQKDVKELKDAASDAREQMGYLVGSMEALTGRKYRPSRRHQEQP